MALSTAAYAIVEYRKTGKKGVLGNIINGTERLFIVSLPAEDMLAAMKEDKVIPTSCIILKEEDVLKDLRPINNTAKKLIHGLVEASWGTTEDEEEEDEENNDTIPLGLKNEEQQGNTPDNETKQ